MSVPLQPLLNAICTVLFWYLPLSSTSVDAFLLPESVARSITFVEGRSVSCFVAVFDLAAMNVATAPYHCLPFAHTWEIVAL